MTARPNAARKVFGLSLSIAALVAACGDSKSTPKPDDTLPAHCSDGTKSPGESDIDCGGPCAPCRNGRSCVEGTDCAAGYCGAGYLCWPAQCGDGSMGLTETGLDCGGPCPACVGGTCAKNAECVTGFCDGGTCAPSSCSDGLQNGRETAVDCGGGECPACLDGATCLTHVNCESGYCNAAGVCAPPSCTDGVKNQTESDIDCGGPCTPCVDGRTCNQPVDCQSTKCVNGSCSALAATCGNGQRDGDETDVDCGNDCAPCTFGKLCGAPEDCRSNLCEGGACTAPASCSDAAQSPGESDIDCGGNDCPPCDFGQTCKNPLDCASLACHGLRCDEPNCYDDYKNGLETDVDCGGGDAGSDCPACADAKRCQVPSDCLGGSCSGGFCGSCTDGKKNGDESDIDCGGVCGPCGFGKGCHDGDDCESGACADDGTCCTPNACGFCGELTAESCNGVDDDCDGQTDEGLSAQSCANQKGVCAGAKATCGGAEGWLCGATVLAAHSAAYQGSEATCDKLDNDCDGDTDEIGCTECATVQNDVAGFAQQSGEVRLGQDFVTMHAGKPALAFVKQGTRPVLIVAQAGDYDAAFSDLDGAPAIGSDDTNLFVAYTEDLNSGSIRTLLVRKLLGIDYHTLLQLSDVAAETFSPALAVGGGHAAVVYPDKTYVLRLKVSENTDFGTAWDTYELDTKPDALAQVAVSATGVAHAVWRTDQGQGELQHFTGGAKVGLGVTANDYAIAVGPNGDLHLATREGTAVKYRVWTAGAWSTPTSAGTTDAESDVAVAVDPAGVPYVGFRSTAKKLKIVKKAGTGFAEVVSRTITSSASEIASVAGFGLGVDAKGIVQIGAASYDASLAGWRYGSFLVGCAGFPDAGPACTPACGGKQCGDDGCGGTCGTCTNGTVCNADGQCAGGCTPNCTDKQCGNNGCGGSCGLCQGDQECNASGQCVTPAGQCGADPLNTCYGRCGLFNEAWSCQCDANCAETGDCCPDLGGCCTATSCGTGATSCGGQCGQYDETRACNCDADCATYYDCCQDLVACCTQ